MFWACILLLVILAPSCPPARPSAVPLLHPIPPFRPRGPGDGIPLRPPLTNVTGILSSGDDPAPTEVLWAVLDKVGNGFRSSAPHFVVQASFYGPSTAVGAFSWDLLPNNTVRESVSGWNETRPPHRPGFLRPAALRPTGGAAEWQMTNGQVELGVVAWKLHTVAMALLSRKPLPKVVYAGGVAAWKMAMDEIEVLEELLARLYGRDMVTEELSAARIDGVWRWWGDQNRIPALEKQGIRGPDKAGIFVAV
ncbi:hypothetical protein DFJ74DRAFT_733853 [Hyaloraphidium curvatum]|nr:hypothetical protein DFJ74DRAFT_733853 [Hyaloraphidium curvatum]